MAKSKLKKAPGKAKNYQFKNMRIFNELAINPMDVYQTRVMRFIDEYDKSKESHENMLSSIILNMANAISFDYTLRDKAKEQGTRLKSWEKCFKNDMANADVADCKMVHAMTHDILKIAKAFHKEQAKSSKDFNPNNLPRNIFNAIRKHTDNIQQAVVYGGFIVIYFDVLNEHHLNGLSFDVNISKIACQPQT